MVIRKRKKKSAKKLKISNNVGKLGVLIITSVVLWLLFLIPYNVGFTLSMITMVLGFVDVKPAHTETYPWTRHRIAPAMRHGMCLPTTA